MPRDQRLDVISPVDGRVYAQVALANRAGVEAAFLQARPAQSAWKSVPIAERALICRRAVDAFEAKGAEIAEELTWQMGRPLAQSPGEVRGFAERARYMIEIAAETLGDIDAGPKS